MTLALDGLSVVFNRIGRRPVRAVVNVSLGVDRGEILGLVGESGSGKSTLGRTAVGLIRPTDGRALFEGEPVRVLSARGRLKSQLGLQMVFQNPLDSLNAKRKVGRQIRDGLARSTQSRGERGERVGSLLEQLGLPRSAAGKFPHQFSGGQGQRVAIARALAAEPTIIVLDEPLASLDASAQAQLANTLRQLADDRRVGMLLISHDLAIVHHIADRIAVMYLGTIVESAATTELWRTPLHPYTAALIQAIPNPDGKGVLPTALPGEVGDPAFPPPGCRFHPRCPYAFAKCRTESPSLLTIAPGREVACWLHRPGEPAEVPSSRQPPATQQSSPMQP